MTSRICLCVLLAACALRAQQPPSPNQILPAGSQLITIGETVRLESKHLHETRDIHIALPSSYSSTKQRFPVIYVLDGEAYFLSAVSAVNFMTTASQIPQMPDVIVVGIPNANRNRDMPVPQELSTGGADRFLAFLADELVPFVEQNYRTHPLRVLIGHSQGGLFAMYAMVKHSSAFQWYLASDAPLFGATAPLLEQVVALVQRPDYRGRLVSVERQLGWQNNWPKLESSKNANFVSARIEITDETHETMIYKGIYEGLQQLFFDYAPEQRDWPLDKLDAKYAALSKAYGYAVPIPQAVLLTSVRLHAMQRHGEEAKLLLQRAVALYGESAQTQKLFAEVDEAIKKGPPDSRVEELLNAPRPSAEGIKPFLGVWTGRLEVPNGVPMDIELQINVVDEKIHAQSKMRGPSGFEMGAAPDFLRVLADGALQWGRKSGRSGGLYVSTVRLIDANTLQGEEELIGVEPPPGLKMPPPNIIVLKRQVALN
ncbi:alpha/beta hydrolase [candidate division KSB1 bacterium]|nr:alpha/beta hydrolase [candidate division KSB1 bacterium]